MSRDLVEASGERLTEHKHGCPSEHCGGEAWSHEETFCDGVRVYECPDCQGKTEHTGDSLSYEKELREEGRKMSQATSVVAKG